jgi:hypothetical protein
LPQSAHPLVIRTSFESRRGWERIRQVVDSPLHRGHLEYVNQGGYRDLTTADLLSLVPRGYSHPFLMVIDHETMSHPESPILVLDLREKKGQTFRVLPEGVHTVESNLAIASVEFEHFVRAADSDGIYRAFPR